MLKRADKVPVPLQPSSFDICATRVFLDELATPRQALTGRHCGDAGRRRAALRL
jgi:hypothetical protein